MGHDQSHIQCVRRKNCPQVKVETCVKGGTSRHIPMLLATTFLVVCWDAATMRGVAQDQPSP